MSSIIEACSKRLCSVQSLILLVPHIFRKPLMATCPTRAMTVLCSLHAMRKYWTCRASVAASLYNHIIFWLREQGRRAPACRPAGEMQCARRDAITTVRGGGDGRGEAAAPHLTVVGVAGGGSARSILQAGARNHGQQRQTAHLRHRRRRRRRRRRRLRRRRHGVSAPAEPWHESRRPAGRAVAERTQAVHGTLSGHTSDIYKTVI